MWKERNAIAFKESATNHLKFPISSLFYLRLSRVPMCIYVGFAMDADKCREEDVSLLTSSDHGHTEYIHAVQSGTYLVSSSGVVAFGRMRPPAVSACTGN
jgi:hypothetical protein